MASYVATILLCACAIGGPASQGMAMDLIGSRWSLHAFVTTEKHQPVPEEVEITLVFDAARVGGNGGCNRYGASYEVKGTELSFGAVMATRMACPGPGMQLEKRFFAVLATVVEHEIRDEQLWLRGPAGTSLVFNRVTS